MRKALPIFFITLFLVCAHHGFAFDLSVQHLTDMGREAFNDGNYDDALKYFQSAQELDPDSKEILYYINVIKRISEDRVTVVREQSALESALNAAEGQASPAPVTNISGDKRSTVDATLDYIEGKSKPAQARSSSVNIPVSPSLPSTPSASASNNNAPIIPRQTRPTAQAVEKVIELQTREREEFSPGCRDFSGPVVYCARGVYSPLPGGERGFCAG